MTSQQRKLAGVVQNSLNELFSSGDDLSDNLSYNSPKHNTVAAIFHIVHSTYPSTAKIHVFNFTCDEKSGVYYNECFFFGLVIASFFVRAMINDGAVKIGDFPGGLSQCAQKLTIFFFLAVCVLALFLISVRDISAD